MTPLATERLVLEPLEVVHAAAMFGVLQDASIFAFTDGAPPSSLADLETRYARLATRASPDGRQRWLNWIVVLPTRGPIGYVQATVEPDGRVWVAYVVEHACRGQGFATEAMRAMLAHLASEPGAREFLATVEVDNHASIRLLERLGFVLDAARDATPGDTLASTERLYRKPPA